MKIEYFGHACFRVTSDNGFSVITDPYTGVGYELPDGLSANVATVSHGHFDHNALHRINVKTVLESVERREIDGVVFETIGSFHDEKNGALRGKNILFKWEFDGLKVCHFGDLGEPCRDELLEQVGEIDVLFIPIGGKYTIDAKTARQYVEKLAPAIVIPMHYKPMDGALDIADEKEFLSFFDNVSRICDGTIDFSNEKTLKREGKIIFMERKHNETGIS